MPKTVDNSFDRRANQFAIRSSQFAIKILGKNTLARILILIVFSEFKLGT